MIKNSPLIMAAGWVVLCLAVVLGSAAMIATPGEAPFSVPIPGGCPDAGRTLPVVSLVLGALAALLLFAGAGHARGLNVQRPWAELLVLQPMVVGFLWLVLPATGPGVRDWVIGGILAAAALLFWRKSPALPRPALPFLAKNKRFIIPDTIIIFTPLVIGLILGIKPDPKVLLISLLTYPLYAIVQLTVFLAIPATRLAMIRLPDRSITIALAVVFMAVHWPNPLVMAATGAAMLIWSRQYLQGRSILQLALVMGLAATTFSQYLPDTVTSHLRVGPGYVRSAAVEQLSLPGEVTVPVYEFLDELYPNVLNRDASGDELTRWAALIDEARRTTRPWQFFTSDEYAKLAAKNNLPAAPPADTHWLKLDATWQRRIRSFGSSDYWGKSGATWDNFTAALYRDILQREASPQGIADWSLELTIGQRKRLIEVLIDNYPNWANEPFSLMDVEKLRLPN